MLDKFPERVIIVLAMLRLKSQNSMCIEHSDCSRKRHQLTVLYFTYILVLADELKKKDLCQC